MKEVEITKLDLYRDRLASLRSLRNNHKRRAMGRKMYYHQDEQGNLVYVWEAGDDPEHHYTLATHAPDDTITLCAPQQAVWQMTAQRRIELICNGRRHRYNHQQNIGLHSDKTRHRNKKQHIRIVAYHQGLTWPNSMPYEPGLKVKDACFLNLEICQDYVRRLDSRSAAHEVRRSIEPMVKLTKVLARMDQLNPEIVKASERFKWNDKLLDKIPDIYNPTPRDAELIYLIGSRSVRSWRYPRMTDVEKKAHDKKVVLLGLAKLRKELYEKHQLYTFTKVDWKATPTN